MKITEIENRDRIQLIHNIQNLESDPNYFYHASNVENLHDIVDDGKLQTFKPWHGTDQEAWPDGSTEKRSYFSDKASNVWHFAPEHGKPVVIRAPKNIASFKKELHTGDIYTRDQIPAKYLEVLTTRGWMPIRSLRSNMSEQINEDVCAPQAIARVLGLPYDEVHQTCVKFKLWRKRYGMNPSQIISAIQKLGWNVKDRKDLTFVKKFAHGGAVPYWGSATLNQVLKKLESNKKYIIVLKDHVIAYVDGNVIDDVNYGKKHKVTNVFEIIP